MMKYIDLTLLAARKSIAIHNIYHSANSFNIKEKPREFYRIWHFNVNSDFLKHLENLQDWRKRPSDSVQYFQCDIILKSLY